MPLPGGGELALSWSRILAPRGWPLQMLGVLPALCTSLGTEETARNLATLGTADSPMAIPLARARAARAPVPVSEIAALRNACPPAEGRDADLAYGRTLPRRLREHGLRDVGADAYFPITADACTTLEVATVEQIRDRLVAGGVATTAEIDEHLANVAAGRVPDLATSPMVTSWGRRA